MSKPPNQKSASRSGGQTTGRAPGTPKISPDIVWFSHAYGYGTDLMYFAPIFRGYTKQFPKTLIPVARNFPVEQYPDIPLSASLRFYILKLTRHIGETPYITELKIPDPLPIFLIIRKRPKLVIIIEFTPTALLAFLFARLYGVRVLQLIESDPRLRGAPGGRLSTFIKSYVTKRVNLLMTNNEHGVNYLRSVLGVASEKIVKLPYLTSDPTSQSPPELTTLARRVEGKLNFLFLNTVTRRKGIYQLVEAIKLLPERVSGSFVCHIAGGGDELEELKKLVNSYGLEDRILFYGKILYKEVGPFYEKADVVICPTLADYRSLAGFEAINAGKPILLSKFDGASSEILENGMNGWEIDPCDVAEFSDKLLQCINNADRRKSFAKRSEAIATKYKLEKIVENLKLSTDEATSKDVR